MADETAVTAACCVLLDRSASTSMVMLPLVRSVASMPAGRTTPVFTSERATALVRAATEEYRVTLRSVA